MLQATGCDGGKLDAFAFCEDHLRSAEVDVGECDVFDTLVIDRKWLPPGAYVPFGCRLERSLSGH